MKKLNIAIIGGGFAGVQAAKALARSAASADITLYCATETAAMIPALPDLVSGRLSEASLTRPLTEILGPEIRVVVDPIRTVRTDQRVLESDSASYSYDGLILATGSIPSPLPSSFQSARIFTGHSIESSREFRLALQRQASESRLVRVVIVGGGYTGLELAMAIDDGTKEGGAEIHVIDGASSLLPMLDDAERARALGEFARRGITVKTGTTVASIERVSGGSDLCRVHLSDGQTLDDVLVCWSAGMVASPVAMDPAVGRSPDGRIEVNSYLQVPDHPEVLVAGDLAALRSDGGLLRRAVNFAYYSGRRAGQNLAAHLLAGRLREFRPVDLGYVMPLGDATAGRVFGGIPLRGRKALRAHYVMCGIRHFGGGKAGRLFQTAFQLQRKPQPLSEPSGQAVR